jgi:hypothetical protein
MSSIGNKKSKLKKRKNDLKRYKPIKKAEMKFLGIAAWVHARIRGLGFDEMWLIFPSLSPFYSANTN